MWRRVKVKTKPTADPITLEALKKRARVDFDDDDALLAELLKGAVARIDGPAGIGYAMMAQTWVLTLDRFPAGCLELPGAPVTGVVSIKYDDADGVEQTVDPADYRVDLGGDTARVEPVVSWPGTADRLGAVRFEYTLGAATAADVPADLIDAVCLLVGVRYENREAAAAGAMAVIPLGFESIVAEYRRLAAA